VPTVGGTKNPDLAAIVALAPDLVIMDKEENRARDASALQDLGVRVRVTQVRALDDVGPTLVQLGEAVGRLALAPSEPHPLKERHREELEQVAPVVLVDGQDLFWWGSRSPGALDRLRQLAATRPGR
jgi:ABC-type hemin transport system substrate-binding protein